MGPHPDRAPSASPEGAPPACRHCRRPIVGDQWCVRRIAPLRCEPYDRPFLLDTLYRVADLIDGANLAEEEEPEPGGATSAWEHHYD